MSVLPNAQVSNRFMNVSGTFRTSRNSGKYEVHEVEMKICTIMRHTTVQYTC